MGIAMLVLALLTAGSAPAAEARGPGGRGDRSAAAPAAGGQVVCRELAESGSRLVRRRVCMTRDGWTEHRRLQRAELERMQVNGGIPGVD